jgi:hypothetical protein
MFVTHQSCKLSSFLYCGVHNQLQLVYLASADKGLSGAKQLNSFGNSAFLLFPVNCVPTRRIKQRLCILSFFLSVDN